MYAPIFPDQLLSFHYDPETTNSTMADSITVKQHDRTEYQTCDNNTLFTLILLSFKIYFNKVSHNPENIQISWHIQHQGYENKAANKNTASDRWLTRPNYNAHSKCLKIIYVIIAGDSNSNEQNMDKTNKTFCIPALHDKRKPEDRRVHTTSRSPQ